jgi:hypothetical protein
VTGQPSGAATSSTANAPSAEVTDVPAYSTPLSARENVGAPDGRMGIQDQVTPIGREAAGFHDYGFLCRRSRSSRSSCCS